MIPTGVDSAYCVIFVYSKMLVPSASLAAAFERHCLHNPFFEMTPRSHRGPEKAGAIPIGRVHPRVLPGIIALGEAALVQPPLMGTAFNESLETTNDVCKKISWALEHGRGLARVPRQFYPTLKHFQDRLQLLVVRMLIEGNVEQLDRVFRALNGFSEHLNFKFFSNELTWLELVNLTSRLSIRLLLGRAQAY